MTVESINPFVRTAMIQPAIFESKCIRKAYDNRLFYVLEGNGTLITEGKEFELFPETLIILGPDFGYCFRGRMRVLVLNFDMTRACAAHKLPERPPHSEGFDEHKLFDTTVIYDLELPVVRHGGKQAYSDLMSIVYYFNNADSVSDAITSALLKKVIAELLGTKINKRDPEKKLVEDVKRYIQINAASIKSNREIGEHFGYNHIYLAAVFRKRTGEGLHCAIVNEKLNKAKEMLLYTDASIEEIANDTGFSSRSHFCATFKEKLGISPRQFRIKK